MNKQNKNIHRYRGQIAGYQKGKESRRAKWVKGVKCMVTEGDETFGSAHTTQYTGDVQLENCTLETHTTL